jgi:hypothetical protein
LSNRKIDWDNGSLKALKQLLLLVGLFFVLRDSPQEVLIAQLVDFLQRKGDFELFVDFNDSILHLFLLGFLLFQLVLHLLVAVLRLLDLCL